MTKTDREALQAAMETARGERPERAAQLDSMLKDRSWTEVAVCRLLRTDQIAEAEALAKPALRRA